MLQQRDLDAETKDVLDDIRELGYVCIGDGKLKAFVKPQEHVYTDVRWKPTLEYLSVYAKHHPDFGGEFFVCAYDGWREYSEPVAEELRNYTPWSSDASCREWFRTNFVGQGNAGEARFRHKADNASLYPELPHKVLAYERHVGDRNVLIMPNAEFLTTQYRGFTSKVDTFDIPWEKKHDKIIWRGGPNFSKDGYGYYDHGYGKTHPRELAVQLANHHSGLRQICDCSYERADISWQLQYKYILNLDGMVSAWSATHWKLYSNSLVLQGPSHWEHWISGLLKPYVHYLPFDTFYQLPHLYKWCQYNDTKCRDIVQNATELAKSLTLQYALKEYTIQ
jgi:hypothetical protein